jgi:excinuclease UvrABC ATPase subunit
MPYFCELKFQKMDNQITISELLKGVGQLSVREFEEFFNKIQSIRTQKIPHDLNDEEYKLLKQIKSGLLSAKQVRFNYLIARRDAHTITENERHELLKLTDDIEKNDVIRLKKMAKLADLKGISLPDVARIFNITPYQHG